VRRKTGNRETHFYHVLTEAILEECVTQIVGTLAVSRSENVREADRGRTGNKRLHSWAFGGITQYLDYRERNAVSRCWKRTSGRRRRRLTVWERREIEPCRTRIVRLFVVGAGWERVLLRGGAPEDNSESSRGDWENGCVAQPSVYLSDRENGTIRSRDQVVSQTHKHLIYGIGSPTVHVGEDVTSQYCLYRPVIGPFSAFPTG